MKFGVLAFKGFQPIGCNFPYHVEENLRGFRGWASARLQDLHLAAFNKAA